MTTSSSAVPGRIFISYRREDTAYAAGWLFGRLADHFGQQQVFKDVDSIQLGDDFIDVIAAAVGSCDVLLSLIGDRWLTITDSEGRRRLDAPDDYVRLEIEAALTRDIRVIPILVEGARMPRADELPASLAKLTRRQALELSPSQFDYDSGRLLRALDRTLAEVRRPSSAGPDIAVGPPDAGQPSGKRRRVLARIGILAGVAAGVVVVVVLIATLLAKPHPTSATTIILKDDFSSRVSGWQVLRNTADGRYSNGTYQIRAAPKGDLEFAVPEKVKNLYQFAPSKLSISVTARRIAGSAQDTLYGIVCRAADNHAYGFGVENNTVVIFKLLNGVYKPLISVRTTAAVRVNSANRLQATSTPAGARAAVHLVFWVNGQKVLDVTDKSDPLTNGTVGLFAATNFLDNNKVAGAEFSNIVVTRV